MFYVFPLCYCLVVSTSAINCLERLVSKVTYYVSCVTLNPTHSRTHSWGTHSSVEWCKCQCDCSGYRGIYISGHVSLSVAVSSVTP